jgi:hypothetical protein
MHGTRLRGKRIVVQRFGETNRELQAELESEGADVTEIVTYRWTLPENTAPLLRLIGDGGAPAQDAGRHAERGRDEWCRATAVNRAGG